MEKSKCMKKGNPRKAFAFWGFTGREFSKPTTI
jgi:hypothetical protein